MNIQRINWLLLCGIFVWLTPVSAQSSGPYILEWYTIDGGGGVSSGGQYNLNSTIGQPDAGTTNECNEGNYILNGGFLVGKLLLPDGHWWKLDECEGNTAGDSVDDDDGSFNGGEPNWVDGIFGCAVDFDGVNDYFSVSSLNSAYSSTSTFTVAGRFKTSQSTGMQTIVGQWLNFKTGQPEYYPTLYFGWQVLVENNKVVARFGPASSTPSDITGTSDVNDVNDANDGWHHFALVYPTSDSNAVLYVDGQSQGTPGTKTFYPHAYDKFRIGDGSYGYAPCGGTPVLKGGPFNGMIDELMIFNEALSAEDVEQLYEEGAE